MSKQTDTKELYTADEAGRRLGLGGRTVRRYIKAGEFPNAYQMAPRRNSTYLIPAGDIESFEKRRMASYRAQNDQVERNGAPTRPVR